MELEIKDYFTLSISVSSLLISFYHLWYSRRKKLNIYCRPHLDFKDKILKHFLIFHLVNKSNRNLQISTTGFYLYTNPTNRFNKIYDIISKKNRYEGCFSEIQGGLYDELLEPDKLHTVTIDGYEIFTNYFTKNKTVISIEIYLIDMDGRKYNKKLNVNQLSQEDYNYKKYNEFRYPLHYFKQEVKINKQKVKEEKLKNNE